ncbi:MAG TPA: class II aldolase/adducin family protein [Devosiaceae bacterium]|jgi:ribulose-5-phosphate 4-epimerase/fuculose-1-phosphate aldolase
MNEQAQEPVLDEAACRDKLAEMCRILAAQDLIGMFGHVSIRVPGTDLLVITPGAGANKHQVGPSDLFKYNLAGELLERPQGDVQIPIEWRIHTQMHRDNPAAGCVAHLHAKHATVLSIAGHELKPVFTQGAVFKDGVPVWDNPRLVMTDQQAASLSEMLGDKKGVVMRGHGVCVVGETAEECLFRCIFLEENAQKQYDAAQVGEVIFLTPQEAEDCARGVSNKRLYELVWRYYLSVAQDRSTKH